MRRIIKILDTNTELICWHFRMLLLQLRFGYVNKGASETRVIVYQWRPRVFLVVKLLRPKDVLMVLTSIHTESAKESLKYWGFLDSLTRAALKCTWVTCQEASILS